MEKNIKNEETSNAHHITRISRLLQLKHVVALKVRVVFWSLLFCIWVKYVDLQSKYLYYIWIPESTDQKNPEYGRFLLGLLLLYA